MNVIFSCNFKINFSISLPSWYKLADWLSHSIIHWLKFSKWFLSFRFSHQYHAYISLLSHMQFSSTWAVISYIKCYRYFRNSYHEWWNKHSSNNFHGITFHQSHSCNNAVKDDKYLYKYCFRKFPLCGVYWWRLAQVNGPTK